MFITKKHIPRRTVPARRRRDARAAAAGRDGAGRDAAGADGRHAEAAVRRRFVPHGMAPGYWVPDKVGSGFEMPFDLRAARAVPEADRDPERPARPLGGSRRRAEPGADHWVASAFLCANKPKRTAGADIYNGTTIDQLIAQKIGQDNLLPSMQLAVEDPGANSSNCGEGYSCAYTNTHLVVVADDAAADGAEPAGRVRAHVRRRQHGRRARRAPAATTGASSTR